MLSAASNTVVKRDGKEIADGEQHADFERLDNGDVEQRGNSCRTYWRHHDAEKPVAVKAKVVVRNEGTYCAA